MGIARRIRTLVRSPELPTPADAVSALWEDALAEPGPVVQREPAGDQPSVAFVIPPPGAGSGGIATVARLVRHFEARGSRCGLFVYGKRLDTAEAARATLAAHFPPFAATVEKLAPGALREWDAVFATGWPSAWAVRAAEAPAARFYLVQDYEPLFYPAGTEAALAEETYRFGFHGIAAGPWLASVLGGRHGMQVDHFDFGVEPETYRLENRGPRERVLFYARPSTPRRGFELGVLALELFHRRHPHREIVLFGEDVSGYALPFPATRCGRLDPAGLNELYNGAAAALVLSFTNPSFVPLEALAAGCIPVVNEGESNRGVFDLPGIVWGAATPHGLADALSRALDTAPDATSAATPDWERSWERVHDAVRRATGHAR